MDTPTINYLIGDATQPQGDGLKLITHICNDVGAWGAGFVLALSKRWDEPEAMYKSLTPKQRYLGHTQFVKVDDNIIVANMIAQHGIGMNDKNKPPIRYPAIRICLSIVNDLARKKGGSVHMPRIGCGLAGGEWSEIENIIKKVMTVNVYVYDLK